MKTRGKRSSGGKRMDKILFLKEADRMAASETNTALSPDKASSQDMILTKKFKLFQRNLSHFMESRQNLPFIVMITATV